MIDCDIHNAVPNLDALFPYLPVYWREYVSQSGFKGPTDTAYPPKAATSARPDYCPPSGAPPGSDFALLRTQALDAPGAEFGILNCAYAIESIHNPYAAAAFATAVNEWQIEHWLAPEPRLRASFVVPSGAFDKSFNIVLPCIARSICPSSDVSMSIQRDGQSADYIRGNWRANV